MTRAERQVTPLRPDIELFFNSLTDEQRAFFMQTANMPAQIFVMPFFRLLAEWWLTVGPIERTMMLDKAIKLFYIEAARSMEDEVQKFIETIEKRAAMRLTDDESDSGASETTDAGPKTVEF